LIVPLISLTSISQHAIWLDKFALLSKGGLKGVAWLDTNIFSSQVVLAIFNIRVNDYS